MYKNNNLKQECAAISAASASGDSDDKSLGQLLPDGMKKFQKSQSYRKNRTSRN